mgnify:FL=1
MSEEWQEYFNDRMIRVSKHGYYVILPQKSTPPVPVNCNVCDLLLRDNDDVEFHRTKNCCRSCALKWADQNLERWYSGWRPTQQEIKEEVQKRQKIPSFIKF